MAAAAKSTSSPSCPSVYDGTRCLGHVIARGKTGWEAFDSDDKSLGVYPTQKEAAATLKVRP
jgi:hypothetical protein